MMDESPLSTPPSETPVEDRLHSWKQIAFYLKRDVTTVQRWEKREGMPVHRHLHDSIGSVYASRAELDAWTRSRNVPVVQEHEKNATPQATQPASPEVAAARIDWRFVWPVAAALVVLAILASVWLQRTERFWRNPIVNARFQTVTDFAGLEQGVALSRDGHFVAFLSDRAGQVDVWLTQVGSGEFHNLTHGAFPGLVNPLLRNLSFSPDGSLVTFWFRKPIGPDTGDIGVWAVPVLGGEARPYLPGVAEFDWTHDGSRIVYHTPGPGDPMFVSADGVRPDNRSIFTATAGLHSHFLSWAPDASFIYFVYGAIPDKSDIWRINPTGGSPERITSHNGTVSHPVLLDNRTLLYLASNADGSGSRLYSMDVARRIPHQLTSDVDRYTSLAASADGGRVAATVATPKRTLWRMQIGDPKAKEVSLTTSTGFSPRLGPDYLLYASTNENSASIWKLANGSSSELWRGDGARSFGGPVISRDGGKVAFSIWQHGETLLYLMQADGTNPRVVTRSLDLRGAPAWSPDGLSIISAADDHGSSHLFRVPLDGTPPTPFVREYSVDPEWSPDGRFLVYSGPDIGTTFSLKAVNADGTPHPLPALTLTRGARHLAFLPGGHGLLFLRGNIQHKDLWLIDLETGAQQQWIALPADFDIRDFDVSHDGREVVFGRLQENSNVVLLDLPRP
jgi:Tol biopolymer transport system component